MRPNAIRRALGAALLLAFAMLGQGCRDRNEGVVKVTVIGAEPRLVDPAAEPFTPPDAILTASVAQGLVRFDASGNIVPGLAERWNVSDDGLSYIFRLTSGNWPSGGRITASQVARLLKRNLGARSDNALKDSLGAVEDIVAMTDRVLEIRLTAPRPNLLQLLAQPEFGILRNASSTGPFTVAKKRGADGEIKLERWSPVTDREEAQKEELLLAGAAAPAAVRAFVAGKTDLVLGGTFADLPHARAVKLPRRTLVFDPVAGLFGLVPTRASGPLSDPEVRRLLSQAIDREALVATLDVPGLLPRATVLEAGLDGGIQPVPPPWTAQPLADRRAALVAEADRLFGKVDRPTIRIALPEGPGGQVLLGRLRQDWGALGLEVEPATSGAPADLRLVDMVAPSTSPAWFLRQFRCGVVPICLPEADELLDGARAALVADQRAALLGQAASLMDREQLFIPLTAPVRWSLVSRRIEGFAGNRFGRHTLTDLEQKLEGQ
jgi:oligopeptide transport system substrate-binding protein